jgi:phage terminase large subunit-like protein
MTTADQIISFINRLPISSGEHAGRLFQARPWQEDVLRRIYAPGVRDALITLPRKNGKTGLVSTLVMAHLVGPCAVPRGQIVSCAADRGQAGLIYNEAKAMVERVIPLQKRVQIYETTKRLVAPASGSFYAALSSDAFRLHGLSPSVVIFDELAQVKSRRLFDALITASGAHANPLRIVISTKSPDPNHVMSELCDYGQKVRDGILVDESFVYVDFSAPPDSDIWDEQVWHSCNPALGDFRSLEDMRNLATKAKRIPSLQSVFRQYYLNQAIDAETEQFVSAADWDSCGAVAQCTGPAYFGLDLSSTRDMTALIGYWPDSGAVRCWFWLPGEDLATRAEQDRAPYPLWVEQGHLHVTPGKTVDKRAVVKVLAEVMQAYQVEKVGFDRWRILEFRQLCDDVGLIAPLEEHGQGYRDMAPATDELERAILARELAHGGHPVLRWHCANIALDIDASGNRKPTKRRSRGRIDGITALMMACHLAAKYRVEPALQPTIAWL